MTNEMIILTESIRLMDEGILKGSGIFAEMEINGKITRLELPEKIHTYARWKELGYQVRRGETSNIKITVWKYRGKKSFDEESGQEIEKGRCYPKLSAFFTLAQVDRITA